MLHAVYVAGIITVIYGTKVRVRRFFSMGRAMVSITWPPTLWPGGDYPKTSHNGREKNDIMFFKLTLAGILF